MIALKTDMKQAELLICGAGPAGMAAALSARKNGIENILVVEREPRAGGVLPQCIHTGFGLREFGDELTGPEYFERVYELLKKENIKVITDSAAIEIASDRSVLVASAPYGVFRVRPTTVIIATGCRERPLGSLPVSGTRPSGIFTAGAAQKLINIRGMDIGDDIVILGSGDIGMIMGRRLKLMGKNVVAMVEQAAECSGLLRNRKQCIEDFNINLLTSHTITGVHGEGRISGVDICPVDERLEPLKGKEQFVPCRTLLISAGLIPERELTAGLVEGKKTPDWIFFAGNAAHVHDLVDDVSAEGALAGKQAADFIKYGVKDKQAEDRPAKKAAGLKSNQLVCTVCPAGCVLTVGNDEIEGARCEKGLQYARRELCSPVRHVTATVAIVSGERLPVRTSEPVDRGMIFPVMEEIKKYIVLHPIRPGDILIKNVAGSGSDIVAAMSYSK